MKIYTKTGDKGTTALFGGTRVPKSDLRIDAYGTVDELNSYIGLVRDLLTDEVSRAMLQRVQDRLFTIGAILATDPEKATLKSGKDRLNIPKVAEQDVFTLEEHIDQMNDELPPMTHFVLPGGHPVVSHCHIARCICRRAERLSSALFNETVFDPMVLTYLNRLSDYLFVLARKISKDFNAEEIKWIPEKY